MPGGDRRVDSDSSPESPIRSSVVRYVLVGALLALVDFVTFMVLTELGVLVPFAQLVSRTTGAVLAFLLHRYYTFDGLHLAQRHGAGTQAVLFTALLPVFILGSAPVVTACVALVGHRAAGKLTADVLLFVASYLTTRWLFRPAERATP